MYMYNIDTPLVNSYWYFQVCATAFRCLQCGPKRTTTRFLPATEPLSLTVLVLYRPFSGMRKMHVLSGKAAGCLEEAYCVLLRWDGWALGPLV